MKNAHLKPVISQLRVHKVRKAQITNAKDETFNRKVSENEERAQLDSIHDDSKSFRNIVTCA